MEGSELSPKHTTVHMPPPLQGPGTQEVSGMSHADGSHGSPRTTESVPLAGRPFLPSQHKGSCTPSLPRAQKNAHSRQHQRILGQVVGLGILLIVEHVKRPQDSSQASPRNQHCRQSPSRVWAPGQGRTNSHSQTPIPSSWVSGPGLGQGPGLSWAGPQLPPRPLGT